jgi:hypothetical protein
MGLESLQFYEKPQFNHSQRKLSAPWIIIGFRFAWACATRNYQSTDKPDGNSR